MIGEIEKFDNLGRGILYDNGVITFVPKTAPGDVIEYEIIKKAKKYNIGKLKRVIMPSKIRITPKCPYFDNCGGCDLQHISYKDTIKYKKDNINYLLKKHNYSVKPMVIENDKCFNYRNKISLKIIDGKIGYYESDTNKIVPINNCLLAKESINNIISNLGLFNIKNGLITIRCNELDEILLIITTEDPVNLDNISSNIIGIIINDKLCYGIDTIKETINNIVYQISYNSFFQVNSLVASKMFNIIKENIYGDNILDLYCGVGAITLQVASNAKNVTGVEIVSNAISNASYNAKLNGINNAKFILQDSSKAIKGLKEYYDTIIVDPPRVGLSNTVCNYLINSNSKRIIYVSCNPQTLFRDLNILKEKYDINSFYLFDMFSYTEHCESIAILERR